jgi:hypothetical protein
MYNIRSKPIFVIVPVIAILLGAIPSAMAQQNGYNLTVNVTAHGFGQSQVNISVTTENGYRTSQSVYTAGGASWTFGIPPNQGNSVQVCVGQGIIGANCQNFNVNGGDIAVNMAAGGIG